MAMRVKVREANNIQVTYLDFVNSHIPHCFFAKICFSSIGYAASEEILFKILVDRRRTLEAHL